MPEADEAHTTPCPSAARANRLALLYDALREVEERGSGLGGLARFGNERRRGLLYDQVKAERNLASFDLPSSPTGALLHVAIIGHLAQNVDDQSPGDTLCAIERNLWRLAGYLLAQGADGRLLEEMMCPDPFAENENLSAA